MPQEQPRSEMLSIQQAERQLPTPTATQLEVLQALDTLRKQGGWHNKTSVAQITRLPSQTVKEVVDQLVGLGLVQIVERTERSFNPKRGRWRSVKVPSLLISERGLNALRLYRARQAGAQEVQMIYTYPDRHQARLLRHPMGRPNRYYRRLGKGWL